MGFRISALALVSVALLACAGVANAGTIRTVELSTHSSDSTPAEYFLATFTFEVSGAGDHLKLTVENKTGDLTPAYALSQVFFNSAAGVGLSLTGEVPTGWSWGGGHAGGFGIFDFHLKTSEAGGSPGAIAAGGSLIFEFTIDTGGGPAVDAGDFDVAFSTIPPGNHPAIAAAKFIQGPGDDSGYGAYIPLPPALPMGIAGLLGVAVLGRRKRARIINPG